VTPDTSAAEVSRILASYNLVSLPVVDEQRRLVGVVTIDDVLDHLLPDDWRSTSEHDEPTLSTVSIPIRGRRTPNGTRNPSRT
jgi:CBS domain-containing protein